MDNQSSQSNVEKKYISTDEAIPAILYGVANKVISGLDVEQVVKVAQTELLGFWSRDEREIEKELLSSEVLSQEIKCDRCKSKRVRV